MRLGELLPSGHILVPMEAKSSLRALAVLADRLARAGALRDPAAVEALTADDRRHGSVLADGNALVLHSRIDAVDRLVVGLGVAREPLRVEPAYATGPPADLHARLEDTLSPPGHETVEAGATGLAGPRIVAVVLAPPGAATLYLQTIATLARVLGQERVARQLSAAESADDVVAIRDLVQARVEARLTARDIMSRRITHAAPEQSVHEAVDRMLRQGVRALPVLGQKREVLGIVTQRDVLRALLPQVPRAGRETLAEDAAARELRVRDVMSRSVLCITEDTGVEEVTNLMISKDVDQLPVVHEGRISGIITRSDIIRKLFRQ